MTAFNSFLRIFSLALLLAVAMAVPARAWWAKGHMAIAEIAWRNLKPDVQEKVQACATMLKTLGPFPQTTTMVEMGPWADDLKSLGLYTMASWHFIDQVYNPSNITMTINPVQNVNVMTLIPMLIKSITHRDATSDSIATSVANLIHFVGDIHMPLHCTCLFSETYPLGDNGGNNEKVVVNDKGASMPLHAFWDSMAEGPQDDPMRPLSPKANASLQAFVDDLIAENIFSEEQRMNTNATDMARESYNYAVQYVYPGVSNNAVLTKEYKNRAKVITHQRVTLAGYRLATILNAALAHVSLDKINKSTKQIQDGVKVTQTGDTYNYYAIKGVERGAAAGIFLSCFAIGCMVATAVLYAICFVRRGNAAELKNGAQMATPAQESAV